jgi:hypothetical protein
MNSRLCIALRLLFGFLDNDTTKGRPKKRVMVRQCAPPKSLIRLCLMWVKKAKNSP